MTFNLETVRKIMGWCPHEKVVNDYGVLFSSENAFRTGTATGGENDSYMSMPVQMFDWRIIAVLFGFIGLLLIGLLRSDMYIILASLFLYASLIIFDQTKISVDGGILRIRFPVLGEKRYPESNIEKIELIENYIYRHRMRSLIALTLVILISLSSISIMIRISALLLVYVFYSAIRISRFPQIMRISTGGRNIILYPRNEHDLLMLKSIAPGKVE